MHSVTCCNMPTKKKSKYLWVSYPRIKCQQINQLINCGTLILCPLFVRVKHVEIIQIFCLLPVYMCKVTLNGMNFPFDFPIFKFRWVDPVSFFILSECSVVCVCVCARAHIHRSGTNSPKKKKKIIPGRGKTTIH